MAAVEGLFLNTRMDMPLLQYWAESGSGPSPWDRIDKDIYLPRLKELFSAHDWEHIEEQPDEPYTEPPKGGAHALAFHSMNMNWVISM